MKLPYPFDGRLVMIGFGCIGRGVLPLLLRHIDMQPGQLLVISPDEEDATVAAGFQVPFKVLRLTEENHRAELDSLLGAGDFLLNLSVQVESAALIALCQERGTLYLDTCTEPWAGSYTVPSQSPSERSNYALRERTLARRRGDAGGSTALITHGANPGLVSHLLKQALLDLAADLGQPQAAPLDRLGWATLAQQLGVRCIHIAERDSQYGSRRKSADEFVNTWSVDGFISEACQPAELGWGSHEKDLPPDGRRHAFGCQAAIYLERPGAATLVRTWTPGTGPTLGFLITHSEAISIADYLTVGRGEQPEYRPTVHYAYHPCDDAVLSLHELAARNWRPQVRQRLLNAADIEAGADDLGVLLLGHARGAYWYGSRLTIEQARALCQHNSATSLQVSATVMAGVIWTLVNPDRGILEPDQLPHDEILELCRPYLGELAGYYSDWTPLQDRERLFPEELDLNDPWQFVNVRYR
ncbi:homospermidine synthase [Pseudomonas taiwanensis]|uniref:homospermidine synthase n=1 Tax=Pseudomonas taiwanensis TaxID=470150 RepID=UPI0015BF8E7D|nr:saccharopine dehydrogenase C-terminal domain-containing protein [Pseudomonas taiwanensis]NWL77244.1 homospermidine synthase [Pseudomonas taiwanensis]